MKKRSEWSRHLPSVPRLYCQPSDYWIDFCLLYLLGRGHQLLSSAFHIVAADAWRWACMARRFCITAPKPRNACHWRAGAVPPWPRRASHATLSSWLQVQRKQRPTTGVGHVLHKVTPCCGDRGGVKSLRWPPVVALPVVYHGLRDVSALCGLTGAGEAQVYVFVIAEVAFKTPAATSALRR